MELLSNNSNQNGNNDEIVRNQNTDQQFQIMSEILDSDPSWGEASNMPMPITPPGGTDYFPNMDSFQAFPALLNVGAEFPRNVRNSTDSGHSSIGCGWCDSIARKRCVDCNEFLCRDCVGDHQSNPQSSAHMIISLPTPIGSSPTGQYTPSALCDIHCEILRYICEHCKKMICQSCVMLEHKDHHYSSVQVYVDDAGTKLEAARESANVGTKRIKGSIDTALAYIRFVERDCLEVSDAIRKSFRQFIMAIEDRERYLLDLMQKMKQRRLSMLHEQMAGLKSALSGLAETSDMLNNLAENRLMIQQKDLAMQIANGQRQLEQFASIYKDLQPRKGTLSFTSPDFKLLHELRAQGDVVFVDEKQMVPINGAFDAAMGMYSFLNGRNPMCDNSFQIASSLFNGKLDINPLDWNLTALQFEQNYTKCVPGSLFQTSVSKSPILSMSFASEGHDDGRVSRPWGLCVDKNNNIIVSDRRNNRIQVFSSEGIFKFKFGRKGSGNGEFDLPAGICVDVDNRIIVVDKDNHRIQIFTSSGVFLQKFGKYGKEYGQFQYPWDVSANSKRQIVVTDSRNNRIQQFDSEGRFIRQLVFDTTHLAKGIASPRGICYNPQGNIIVSDFDNHCLYLIDSELTEILAAKGTEGSGMHEFNRPSGLCCDDEGRVIVADSKNQRIVVFTANLDFMWDIEVRPSRNPKMPRSLDEKDRTCDVALMSDGRIVFLIELSPDSKEGYNPHKKFVHCF